MKKLLKLLPYIPAVICMAAIFYFSAQGGEQSTALSDGFISSAYGEEYVGENTITTLVRKSAHFLEYALLGALVFFGSYFTFRNSRARSLILIAGTVSGLYAVSDELHQYFVPGRACRVTDMLIDTCGAFAGAVIIWLIFLLIGRIKSSRRKNGR